MKTEACSKLHSIGSRTQLLMGELTSLLVPSRPHLNGAIPGNYQERERQQRNRYDLSTILSGGLTVWP